jgi:hypothetical protein
MCMSAYRADANLAVLRLLFSPGSQEPGREKIRDRRPPLSPDGRRRPLLPIRPAA